MNQIIKRGTGKGIEDFQYLNKIETSLGYRVNNEIDSGRYKLKPDYLIKVFRNKINENHIDKIRHFYFDRRMKFEKIMDFCCDKIKHNLPHNEGGSDLLFEYLLTKPGDEAVILLLNKTIR